MPRPPGRHGHPNSDRGSKHPAPVNLPSVGSGGKAVRLMKLPTPRRAYLLVDGYCSRTPGL